ncbi:MAG: hypothetical protein ACOYYS_19630, partial [Chloroflexota bacterium]
LATLGGTALFGKGIQASFGKVFGLEMAGNVAGDMAMNVVAGQPAFQGFDNPWQWGMNLATSGFAAHVRVRGYQAEQVIAARLKTVSDVPVEGRNLDSLSLMKERMAGTREPGTPIRDRLAARNGSMNTITIADATQGGHHVTTSAIPAHDVSDIASVSTAMINDTASINGTGTIFDPHMARHPEMTIAETGNTTPVNSGHGAGSEGGQLPPTSSRNDKSNSRGDEFPWDLLPKTPRVVVDLGSGGCNGYPLSALSELGTRYPNAIVAGIEGLPFDVDSALKELELDKVLEWFAPTLKSHVRDLPPNTNLIVGDYTKIVADNSADLVTVFAPEPNNIYTSVNAAARIVKPDGGIMIAIRSEDLAGGVLVSKYVAEALAKFSRNPVQVRTIDSGKTPGFANSSEVTFFYTTMR